MLRVAFCSDMYRGRISVSHNNLSSRVPKAGDAVNILVTANRAPGVPLTRQTEKYYKPHMLPTWLGTNTRPAGTGEEDGEKGRKEEFVAIEGNAQNTLCCNKSHYSCCRGSSSTRRTIDWNCKDTVSRQVGDQRGNTVEVRGQCQPGKRCFVLYNRQLPTAAKWLSLVEGDQYCPHHLFF